MNDFHQVLNDTVEVIQHPLEFFGALNYSEKLLIVSITFLIIAFYICFDDLLRAPTSKLVFKISTLKQNFLFRSEKCNKILYF